ncbi:MULTISPECIES: ThuA domain-containing protein [Mumia]|uniref:ThuA domain-containing protein n=1 Tax=Mumia TaxID=1546255 RepID=UPI00141FF417|nr:MULTISPECIES: ThuA domain-containing protein [unclassified Mumia]QMW66760.1 ThuA domain-containing protein [Mumia sp. ZJ1417]
MRGKLTAALSAVTSAAATVAAVAAFSPAGHGHGGGSTNAEAIYTDAITDYGVCRGVDPECYNDWGNGYTEGETKRILIYSRTAGPRHAHLGTPLAPGLNPPLGEDNVAQRGLKAWAEEQGITVDWTEDVSRFSGLSKYQAVVFLSSNRDTLDDTAQTNLRQYVRGGGGFVGIHNAFGAEYNWPWYEGLLGGTNFYDHRPNRPGTVQTLDRKDVSTKNLPRTWAFTDEWYNLEPVPSFVRELAKVDAKTSSTPERASGHPGHGDKHLVSWCQYYDGGKSWLTTLGHDVAAWTDAPLEGDAYFKDHVVHGLLSAMGVEPFCK